MQPLFYPIQNNLQELPPIAGFLTGIDSLASNVHDWSNLAELAAGDQDNPGKLDELHHYPVSTTVL